MSDGTDKLAATVAETIDMVSKSFSKNAPEVWDAAVSFQTNTAVVSILYNFLYIIIWLVIFYVSHLVIAKKVEALEESKKLIIEKYKDTKGYNDRNIKSETSDAEERQFFCNAAKIVIGVITLIVILVNISRTQSGINQLMNSEYYAAAELIRMMIK